MGLFGASTVKIEIPEWLWHKIVDSSNTPQLSKLEAVVNQEDNNRTNIYTTRGTRMHDQATTAYLEAKKVLDACYKAIDKGQQIRAESTITRYK